MKRNPKRVLLLFAGIVILTYFWLFPLHETMHFLACEVMGLEGRIKSIDQTECFGILERGEAEKILYAGMPYFFETLVLVGLWLKRRNFNTKEKEFLFLGILVIIFLDISRNLLGLFIGEVQSDFVKIGVSGFAGKIIVSGYLGMVWFLGYWIARRIEKFIR